MHTVLFCGISHTVPQEEFEYTTTKDELKAYCPNINTVGEAKAVTTFLFLKVFSSLFPFVLSIWLLAQIMRRLQL